MVRCLLPLALDDGEALMSRYLFCGVCLLLLLGRCFAADSAKPADNERLQRIDGVVQQAIERGELPGAVVLILHRGQVVFRKAYGLRSKQPAAVPMTADTVFDLASLTKPIATASSILLLIEQGKLRLTDRATALLPAFGQKGKDKITIEQLLL